MITIYFEQRGSNLGWMRSNKLIQTISNPTLPPLLLPQPISVLWVFMYFDTSPNLFQRFLAIWWKCDSALITCIQTVFLVYFFPLEIHMKFARLFIIIIMPPTNYCVVLWRKKTHKTQQKKWNRCHSIQKKKPFPLFVCDSVNEYNEM